MAKETVFVWYRELRDRSTRTPMRSPLADLARAQKFWCGFEIPGHLDTKSIRERVTERSTASIGKRDDDPGYPYPHVEVLRSKILLQRIGNGGGCVGRGLVGVGDGIRNSHASPSSTCPPSGAGGQRQRRFCPQHCPDGATGQRPAPVRPRTHMRR